MAFNSTKHLCFMVDCNDLQENYNKSTIWFQGITKTKHKNKGFVYFSVSFVLEVSGTK